MRLRTFESFGLIKNGIIQSYPSLHGKNEACEVAVVGGGITGALVSYQLVKNGYNVILIDKRDIACGSTAATTSLLQYEIDEPLYRLSKLIGEQEAASCYKAGINAIHKLNNLVKEHEFDCEFEMKQSLYIAKRKKDVTWLKEEYELRDRYALGVSWLEKKEVLNDYDINCFGAIRSDVAASVDAYKLAHCLIRYNMSKGMKVFDQTAMNKIEISEDKVRIKVEGDHYIECNKVVFCNGYESTEMIKEKIADLFYTYASVSEKGIAVNEKLKETLVWDTGEPYMYMRYTGDGRLLIGGEDSAANVSLFQQYTKERKANKLKKTIAKLISNVEFVEDFSWAGKFGSTKDGLPYIGASPEYQNCLFALGFGGNGITFSVQAMDIISDQLTGKQNPLSYHYRFNR